MANTTSITDPEVIETLRSGKIVAATLFDTRCVICQVASQSAVVHLQSITGDSSQRTIILAADVSQIVELGIKQRYIAPVGFLWPNPLGVVLPAGDELSQLHRGRRSVVACVPDDSKLQELLRATGPLAALPIAPLVEESAHGDHLPVDVNIQDQPEGTGAALTVIQIIDDELLVLQQGAMTKQQIDDLLNDNQ